MFKGFTDRETFTPVPDSFFRQLLSDINDADELRVTLYVLWRIEHMEGPFHTLCRNEILEDEVFMRGMDASALDSGLERAVRRGSLLRVEGSGGGWYFLNSPRGRAAAGAMARGDWRESARPPSLPPVERPNIFQLYEQNIGPLTPLIADTLRDAEQTYPEDWLADAIEEAVKRNKRNWKYVEAILKRWKEDGRHERKDKQDPVESGERYTKGAFSEYIERD
jgi:DnaD/phage-associated family protein